MQCTENNGVGFIFNPSLDNAVGYMRFSVNAKKERAKVKDALVYKIIFIAI